MSIRFKLALVLIAGMAAAAVACAAVFARLERSSLRSSENEKVELLLSDVSRIGAESQLAKDPLMLLDYLAFLTRTRPEVHHCRVWMAGRWEEVAPKFQKDLFGSAAARTVTIASADRDPQKRIEVELWLSSTVLEEQQRRALRAMFVNLGRSVGAVMLLGILISLFLGWTLTRRLVRIESALEEIGQGKAGVQVDIGGGDEIGKLAREVNAMSGKLKELERLKKTFIASVTHELRSPLGAIESYVKGLLAEPDADRGSPLGAAPSETSPRTAVPNAVVGAGKEHDLSRGTDRIPPVGAAPSPSETSPTQQSRASAVVGAGTERDLSRGAGRWAEADRKNLERIRDNASRLGHFVTNLLEMSKIERGKLDYAPRVSDLRKLVDDTVLFFESRAKEAKISLESSVEDRLAQVRMDSDLIGHVVTNLVANALKFTRPGGKIAVSARTVSINGRPAVECAVSDTGVGIPKEALSRIFQPFERVSNPLRATGAGLGLAISKSIIEMHGGAMGVDSEVGKGSRFYFTFPLETNGGRAAAGSG